MERFSQGQLFYQISSGKFIRTLADAYSSAEQSQSLLRLLAVSTLNYAISKQSAISWSKGGMPMCRRPKLAGALAILTALALANHPIATIAQLQQTPTNQTTEEEVTRWVEQLGSQSFATRQVATQRLIDAGSRAKEVVRTALESNDAEVRKRARLILEAIAREEIAARRQAFIDGDLTKLPGNRSSWQRLVDLEGNTRSSRELFWDMQAEAADFLDLCERDPEQALQQIDRFYEQYMEAYRGRGPGVLPGKISAVFLLISREEIELEEAVMKQCVSLLYGRYLFFGKDKVAELYHDDNEAFRELVGRWILKQYKRRNPTPLLSISRKLEIPAGVELARRMLAGNKHANVYKGYAMKTIGAVGSPEDIPALERYFGNRGFPGVRRSETLGDLALAMCVKITAQELTEYGFPPAPPPVKLGNPKKRRYGLGNQQARLKAYAKWRAWKQSQNPSID